MSKIPIKRILETLDVSALKQFSVSTNDSKFDNVSEIIGTNLKPKEMYCITNMPLNDGNYIQSGATHTVLGMEYGNTTRYGFQMSMTFNAIKYRKLVNSTWSEWTDVATVPTIIPITPLKGSNYPDFGNSYYYKIGTKVHVHLGLQGLTGSSNAVFNIPKGYRPYTACSVIGVSTSMSQIITGIVSKSGDITIYNYDKAYAMFDFEYDAFN